ncbi:hypothetical protein Clacol_008092 [Clathrus columnatus]|uniref:Glutamate--tRNA ligase, mitochondrial n=1 Tax=Clathrus columnatus TaxID=1419009 RepID=A0AAV5ALV1_9AGAM|nr:hypothetical protein Clacol_008092 [Clathrus columnatus]
MVLLRFAPSPTGALHLGGLRTALLNHLFSKQLKGKWILRIEDTDNTRFVPGSVENIQKGLEWAGLNYDYGPGIGGPHGPYFQSQRLDLYREFSNKLLETRHAYRCFCSPAQLTAIKDRLSKIGSSATYNRTCLHLTEEEVARRIRSGQKYTIRLYDSSVPERHTPSDLIFGEIREARLSLPTDPILLKSDSFPTYHLASVVDDSQMGITHVFRGEEWLPSLPLHLDLYACFSLSPPQFAHLPLLLNPDGSKMSKRMGDVQVNDYIKKGWEPEAVINWLALTGWGNRSEGENTKLERGKSVPDVFTLEELTLKFQLSKLTNRRGILDPGILRHLNKEHIRLKIRQPSNLRRLVQKVRLIISTSFPDCNFVTEDYLAQVITTLEDRITNILDLPDLAPYFFIDPSWISEAAQKMKGTVPKDIYDRSITQSLDDLNRLQDQDWNHDGLLDAIQKTRNTLQCTSKELMTPLRHALTAMKDGPSVIKILELLGKERTLSRLRQCVT